MEQLYQSRYSGPEIDRRLGLMAGNFLWIKWSNTLPVVEMLDEPGPYIGIYTGESNDPPADPAEYKWYLNKGDNGTPGPLGPEGPAGPPNTLSIGSVQSGATASATITGEAPAQTLNLTLPKGDTGTGLDILGTYTTLAALEAAVPSPTQGDMYNVGEAAPYHVYMWDTTEPPSAWKDQGILHGPPGQDGAQGADGVPGPNEITTATATTLSGVLVGKDGTVREGVAGVHFAAAEHAAQHAADGADPIKVGDTGIWTPYLFGNIVTGTPSYVLRSGRWVKIGDLMLVWATIVLNGKGGMDGALGIGGLPAATVIYTTAVASASVSTYSGIDPGKNYSLFIKQPGTYLTAADITDNFVLTSWYCAYCVA